MTSLLLTDPDAVFLHTPKCAGTSIRALWNKPAESRAFGHIPDAWRGKPVFAVIRNPEARFLSAIRMFKFGNPDFPGAYRKPAWPDLTISKALRVLADDTVPFDRSQRYVAANFKHHIIAQTHPYNCLHEADFLIRQENLPEDLAKLAPIFGFVPSAPHLRNTGGKPDSLVVSPEQSKKIRQAFAEDYEKLGYDPQTGAITTAKILHEKRDSIYQAWSAFFSHLVYDPTDFKTALPADDVDLSLFSQNKVQGKKGRPWSGRSDNLNTHFHNLLPEFVGRSYLAFLLACCIVVIRKSGGAGPGIPLFHRIIDEYTTEICNELNTRWLVSVCDTLADHGRNGAQRGLGLSGSILANTVKLIETERQLFQLPRPWPPNHRTANSKMLFDGVICFWLEKGDMIENLVARIDSVSREDPVAGAFVGEILMRLIRYDTVFKRLSQIIGQPPAPLLPDAVIDEFNALSERWL